MESMAFSYMNQFENIIFISDKISDYYRLLSEEVLEGGKNSFRYNFILSNIKTFENIEKELLNSIFSDSSVLYLFKEFVKRSKCERLKVKLYSDFDILEKIYDSAINEKYDSLLEKNLVTIERDEFKKQEFDEHKNKVFLPCIFNLVEKKRYIKILEYYIKMSNDKEEKKYLISELYTTISHCEALEDWFFGEGNNIDCILVDCDEVVSMNLDLSKESYLNLKNNHFINLTDDFINFIMDENIDQNIIKTLYETNLLSMIMSMDAKTLSSSYRIFRDEVENSKIDKNKVDFVDNTFSKSLLLSKKIG